jgi:hypothetical protein
VGSSGPASTRLLQLGDHVGAAPPPETAETAETAAATTVAAAELRKRSLRRHSREVSVDSMPFMTVDAEGRTVFDAAVAALNACAAGILANAGAATNNVNDAGETPVGGLASIYAAICVRERQDGGATSSSANAKEAVVKMLELCIANGARPDPRTERPKFDALRAESVAHAKRLEDAETTSVRRATQQVQWRRRMGSAAATGSSVGTRWRSKICNDDGLLLFWAEGTAHCFGSECTTTPLPASADEVVVRRHCMSCGLTYCRRCCGRTFSSWGGVQEATVTTMTGETLDACLCVACTNY